MVSTSAHRDPSSGYLAPPSAQWILTQLQRSPRESLTAAVVGPGTTGKTALLDEVAARYQQSGIDVLRDIPELAGANEALLIDDAHLFDEESLTALHGYAGQDGARLLVAYRPWPRPPGLAALGARLSRRSAPVVLGHLDRDGGAEWLAALFGAPPEALVYPADTADPADPAEPPSDPAEPPSDPAEPSAEPTTDAPPGTTGPAAEASTPDPAPSGDEP